MNKRYDNFIFDQHGQSIPLSADEVIDILIQQLNQLQQVNARLEKYLSLARTMLNMFGKDIAVSMDETAWPD